MSRALCSMCHMRTALKLCANCAAYYAACGTYTIKQGDTFLKLAMDKGFPLSDLLAVNPGVVPESLVVGQTVNMPCQGADQNGEYIRHQSCK